MKRYLITTLSIASIFISTISIADKPENSVYLDGGTTKKALILAHGRGKHPTWKVVNPLRKGIHEKLGYHTLSLQLPNDDKKWKKYADDFPEAYKTIIDGVSTRVSTKGILTDISDSGSCLLAHEQLQPEQVISFEDDSLRQCGSVSWSVMIEEQTYRCGIQFC